MDFASFVQDNTVLRPHQIEAKAKIFDAWSKYDSVMLQMPTGTGKTYLFTSLINDIINTYKLAHKDVKILNSLKNKTLLSLSPHIDRILKYASIH